MLSRGRDGTVRSGRQHRFENVSHQRVRHARHTISAAVVPTVPRKLFAPSREHFFRDPHFADGTDLGGAHAPRLAADFRS